MSDHGSPLLELLPRIRTGISKAARATDWPDFEWQIERHLTRTKLPRHVILPLACAHATGGDARAAISAAVACSFLILATRWFDDAQDRDRRESLCNEIGGGRATNMAAAALTVAWRVLSEDHALAAGVREAFGRHTIALARGQDRDLRFSVAGTLDEYWTLMREKTGAALALACEMGAWSGGAGNEVNAAACARFGQHAGVLMQILDDLDGAFFPDGKGDLRSGKATLAVLYGLAVDHDAREELAEIVHLGLLCKYSDRVREILDGIDTREFLVWAAFEERRQALEAISSATAIQAGIEAARCDELRVFADGLMGCWEELLVNSRRLRTQEQVA
jgi:geranylgeranyl diphosphate synthase type I